MFAGLLPFPADCPAQALLPPGLRQRLHANPGLPHHRAGNSLWLPARSLQPWWPRDETQWHTNPHDGTLVAFWGRLDNRDDLDRCWSSPAGSCDNDAQDAARIARGWGQVGPACVEALVGDFAFVLVSPSTRRLLLARDPLGVKPLSYRIDREGIRVASNLPLLRELVPAPSAPDADWMLRYLVQASAHETRTAFPDLLRLAPGHCLLVEDGIASAPRRWFTWRDEQSPGLRRDEQWVERYRERLVEAVRCRWSGDAIIAGESSAGIDSSAIIALLAQQVPDAERRVMSVGLAMMDDEARDILGLSRQLGLRHNHILTRQVIDAEDAEIERSLRTIGHPEENGIAIGIAPLHEVCRERGARHLFSGFGGDEGVSHFGQPLRRELVDQKRYRDVFDVTEGRLVKRSLRTLRACWTGMPAEQAALLARGGGIAHPALRTDGLLRTEALERLGLPQEMKARLRAREDCRTVNAAVIEHGMHAPHVASRLEGCTLMAASRGLEYHWPLLDVRLVQQYLDTPGIEKVGPNGMTRYLHRRAIAPWVLDRITWRPTKDTGLGAQMGRVGETAQKTAAKRARRLAADGHARLDEFMVRATLQDVAGRAEQGRLPPIAAIGFQRQVRNLRWLDAWLKSLDQPGVAA